MKRLPLPLAAGVAALAAGGAFVAGVQVGAPDRGPGDLPSGNDHPAPLAAGHRLGSGDLSLVAAGDCDSLLRWYVDNTRDQVTAWGWGGGVMYGGARGAMESSTDALATAPLATAGPLAKSFDQATSSATGTNVQEAGVDEPDVVKTDGHLLVRLVGDDVVVYDVSGTSPQRMGRLDLPGRAEGQPELLLAGGRAVVLSQDEDPDGPRTRVDTVSLEDPAAPKVVDTTSYAASLLAARQYGDTVRLVLGTGLPMLDFVTPQGSLTEREALEKNRAILADSTISDWLPSLTSGGRSEQVVDCAAMARPEDFTGAGTVSVVGWSAATPDERSSTGVATASQTVYSSADRLYLATSAGWGGCCWGGPGVMVDEPAIRHPWPGGGSDGTTQLHAFALEGDHAAYVGSGEVEGTVRDRWALDAVDGTLRIAVGPSQQTGDWNSVVTLQEKDGALEPLGRVDRLGVGEQLQSVRWFDDLAVLVTFRQVDPLYAVDLSDPAHPRTLGSLKVPGYSDYLHPIGNGRILGLGGDANDQGMTRGGQVAVFDLRDPRHPVRQGMVRYAEEIQVMAGQDPRQLTWVPSRQTAYAVIARYGATGGMTSWVSELRVGADGSLTRHTVRGTDGYDDVAALRTVPLPDGRVVLVTEDSARFL
jgi:hypothetical protein